jgi:23S rRNA-/tRNA-specific pseudouridylate synthase
MIFSRLRYLKPQDYLTRSLSTYNKEWIVEKETGDSDEWLGIRLDRYLIQDFGLPRSLVYKLLRKRRIFINNNLCEGDERIYQGDSIRLLGDVKLNVDYLIRKREELHLRSSHS